MLTGLTEAKHVLVSAYKENTHESKKFDDLGHNSTSSPCARLMHTRIQAQV